MNVRRIVWLGASALAIASWFASASTPVARPPIVPQPPPRVAAIDRSVAALQADVTRLRDRLGPTVAPSGSRDLFRFSARAPKPVQSVQGVATKREAPALLEAPPPVVPRPPLTLIGIAEDASAEGPVRTAIVSGLGDVFLVKMGETIDGRYRVDLVSADAVQLTDTSTDSSATLALH
jgi:hypothetical protein